METRRTHRWIALTASFFLFAWLVSGLAMLAPPLPGEPPAPAAPARPGFGAGDVLVTPAEALEAAGREGGATRAAEIVLRPFRDRLVYEVRLERGGRRLIDARSGEAVTIDDRLAEAIARESGVSRGGVAETSLLREREFFYWGALPVWKVRFDDTARTVVYVDTETGQPRVTNIVRRLRASIVGLHEAEPLRLLTESRRARHLVLGIFALVSLAAVVTGWRLLLPGRRPAVGRGRVR